MCAVGLGNDHQTTGILVKSVNDSGAGHASDTGQAVTAMRNKGIYKRSIGISCCGMNNESSRLVQHEQVCVFKEDVEFTRLRFGFCGAWRWNTQYETLTLFDPVTCLRYRPLLDGKKAVLDQ